MVTFVYAVNCRYGRRELLHDLMHVAANPCVVNKHWPALGDFNQSLDPADASTGGSRITGGMGKFRNCLRGTSLSNLP